ncbi:hemolysin III [Carnobacterium iners]|uniref:Hemolysin III n=1 Tax=Carnobacterium iners TaxID=1073423 RepID=A0A1X7NEV7_9LACT|nr:hemolysin III family protein [Carnobacterium iners]SEK37446.1 hemolysin III [Carnobacterium iners]SMH35845.1 hemolysin III [Carnobacterium iners]
MNEKSIPNQTHFSKRYLIINEVFNAITHGIGLGLSIAGLVILLYKVANNGTAIEMFSYAVYGSTLILLYLCSTLYHSLAFTRARKLFKVFDHMSIFLLIAGTYTPYILIAIGGSLGWTLFGIVWSIAFIGILYKAFWINHLQKYSTWLYIIMGWICVFALKPIYIGLGFNGFLLLLLGGLSFTIGAIFYSLKNVRFMHIVWHLFVLAGTIFMYFSILFYV